MGNMSIIKTFTKRGFTLLEVMVAITIMGIVFTSIFKMHSQTISMTYYSRFYSIAPLLCQKKLAEIERDYKGDETDDSGDFGEDHPGYVWHASVQKVSSEVLEKELKMIRIDVTVSLDNDDMSHTIRKYAYDGDSD